MNLSPRSDAGRTWTLPRRLFMMQKRAGPSRNVEIGFREDQQERLDLWTKSGQGCVVDGKVPGNPVL